MVPLKKILLLFFVTSSIQSESLDVECKNLNSDKDVHILVINKDKNHLLFKQNTYLINSTNNDLIFAQSRSIFLNSFIQYDFGTNSLIEVNSWIHRVTKDEFICSELVKD